jgi:PAS domain S-box-containing protein
VLATAAALFDAHGNRVGAIESIRDITEQKLAEQALKRSEEKYRELVENANSIILRMDNMGIVTFINEFAQRFFGYSEEEITGKDVVGTIVPPVETTGRDLRLLVEDVALNPDRCTSNISENMRRGGERVWIAWTNKPIRYEKGRVVEVLCVGNDITERKWAEEALKESQQQLADIIDFLPDATFVIDREGRVIAWNRAMEEMLGIGAADMLGKGDYEYALPFYGERRPILIDLVFEQREEFETRRRPIYPRPGMVKSIF